MLSITYGLTTYVKCAPLYDPDTKINFGNIHNPCSPDVA